ncbi:hypothetical protein ASY01nite_03660 [Acetobacter syzygii]|uniref:M20 family metallopeptidase n=1 Tax=Acetobacter syzygii TaxID=146476 RepID=UPI0005E0A58E|nr:M20/M25/M40 family metallo-hydrolase [Acetobacter syzygii]GAN72010.1 peptidase M20 [Acetobacter syzygii]GBR64309.1 peptidase M20 [Acetobacter syzygii NRIC 0483]GEL55300.1 hypothetical protein ASY01nite_03660 [Acetobacter syzygii]
MPVPLLTHTLATLEQWTRIPSYAGNTHAMHEMAMTITEFLTKTLGAEIIADGTGNASGVIHAIIDRGSDITLLLYNMYDVMPATPDNWLVPPFEGHIISLPDKGKCFVGRGAENNKGPLVGMLEALSTLLNSNQLDANIEIILDGEEETGSESLQRYMAGNPLHFSSDAGLFPSFCEYGGGPPRMYLGCKGMIRGQITITGGAWGGPEHPIHSSNSPWIANPAWRLLHALDKLSQDDMGTILPLSPLDHEANALVQTLASTFDLEAELRFRATQRYGVSGTTADHLAIMLGGSACNLSSLTAGHSNEPAVIPSHASAKFDLRFPPDIKTDEILSIFHNKLNHDSIFSPNINVTSICPGFRISGQAAPARALEECYTNSGHTAQIWPWAPGTMPGAFFSTNGPGLLIGGLGYGGNAHAANEFVTLSGLQRFLAFMLHWLPATAQKCRIEKHAP